MCLRCVYVILSSTASCCFVLNFDYVVVFFVVVMFDCFCCFLMFVCCLLSFLLFC
ncbi:unnamed protein product [Meloidogyne enterolobii]|uniref:Uncharacterized protein n=1 Tax=Meloidogyne enterolobii TaxID=390850 RepID=A0ACB0YKG8_MELEN